MAAVTDVYSLGAILYELLTGRPPFVGVQPMEVLGQVIHDEPVRPSHLVRRLPEDIQTICLKCLEKNPGRRYSSARALADDLERFLDDKPIIARHISSFERAWRWCRRHPAKTTIALSIVSVLLLVAVFASLYSIQMGHQLMLTSQARIKEQKSKEDALNKLWESKITQADATRMSNQIGQRYEALKAIDDARALGENGRFTQSQLDQMRNATIACLAKSDMRVDSQWQGHVPSSKNILAVNRAQSLYAYGVENQICICRMTSGEQVAKVTATNREPSVLLSDSGDHLAIWKDQLRVYALENGEAKLIYETSSKDVWAFTPDGSKILGTRGDGQLCLVDLVQSMDVGNFGSFMAINDIVVSPDASQAATYDGDSIRVIDLETGRVSFQVDNRKLTGAKHFAWHPNSKYLVIGPSSEGIELWDVKNRLKLKTLSHSPAEMRVCFSATGERLVSYDVWGQSLLVWNVNCNELEFSKRGMLLLAISPDTSGGFRLLEWQKDNRLVVNNISASQIYFTLPCFSHRGLGASTNDFDYSPDGRLLAFASAFGELQIFDSRNYVELNRMASAGCFVHFDRSGSLLTANKRGLARWDISPDQSKIGAYQMGPPIYLSDAIAASPFDVSPDGTMVALPTSMQPELHRIDSPGKSRSIGPPADVRRLSFSPNGERVATGEWASGKACIWDVASGELLHTFEEPPFCMVEYSPDGKWIVTNANRVRIWNAETWEMVTELPVEGTSISGVSVAFSPDSRMIAVSDSNARINLFDPTSARKILALTDPNNRLTERMVFNPDGSQLAGISKSDVVLLWDLVSISEELRSRNLETVNNEIQINPVLQSDRAIEKLHIKLDRSFVEIEAERHSDFLRMAVEEFDIVLAHSAISRLMALEPTQANTCNVLAWVLATGPEPLRNSTVAVAFARRAIADETVSQDDRANYLNTLGLALYRNRELAEAIRILEQSMTADLERIDPFNLYFLSMCSSRMGDDAKARSCFEKAESLAEQVRLRMTNTWKNEIAQFAQEAKLLLDEQPIPY